jgi:hypothetical protein
MVQAAMAGVSQHLAVMEGLVEAFIEAFMGAVMGAVQEVAMAAAVATLMEKAPIKLVNFSCAYCSRPWV